MIKEFVEDADMFVVMPDYTGANDLKCSEEESKGEKVCKRGAWARAEIDSEVNFIPSMINSAFPYSLYCQMENNMTSFMLNLGSQLSFMMLFVPRKVMRLTS